MESQHDVSEMGGTMRLGRYPAKLEEGSLVRKLYGQEIVYERHRHRWEVNNRYRKDLESAGLRLSGMSPDDNLVEFIELIDHPFFVGTQAHPEFQSRPDQPHPLFAGLVGAAIDPSEPTRRKRARSSNRPGSELPPAWSSPAGERGVPWLRPSLPRRRTRQLGRTRCDPPSRRSRGSAGRRRPGLAGQPVSHGRRVGTCSRFRPGNSIRATETRWLAAKREFAEEVGATAAEWICLTTMFPSPGYTDESIAHLRRHRADLRRPPSRRRRGASI